MRVAMDKKLVPTVERKRDKKETKPSGKKMSEYGRQLQEKQKVKHMYGMLERQFRRFFAIAVKQREGATGENFLSLLERRLDNVVFRLKMAKTRSQARQMVVHGHIQVNNETVFVPSFLVSIEDAISLHSTIHANKEFMDSVVERRMKMGIKVPDWLELDKKQYTGYVLRVPVRADIQVPIEEHLIVEFYSK
jgi:small subunit ribosomal protein S4